MTDDEARKVTACILDGAGYADADVAYAIIEELKAELPEVAWGRLLDEFAAEEAG